MFFKIFVEYASVHIFLVLLQKRDIVDDISVKAQNKFVFFLFFITDRNQYFLFIFIGGVFSFDSYIFSFVLFK